MRAKLFSVLMLAMLVLVLAACGKPETASTNDEDASTATESASSTDSATPSETESPPDSASGSDSATPEEASPPPEASTDDDTGDAKDDDSKADENPPPVKQDITVQVEIKDFAFSPAEIEIGPGTKVEFINRDSVKHTATADDATFDTGLLEQDKSQIVTFDKEGTFTYYCAPHPAMTGKIVVKAN